jgi:hypothetical protein
MTSSTNKSADRLGTNIPGVVASEIERAYREGACDLPIADRTELEEFFTSVLTYVQDWYSHASSDDKIGGAVAFVLSRRPRTEVPAVIPEVETIHFFDSKKDRPLAGKVYFAAAGVRDTRCWSSPGEDVEGITKSLLSVGFGNHPAVLIDLSTRQARLCRNGVDEEQSTFKYQIPQSTTDLGVESIDDFLDGFHEAFLNPNDDQSLDLWASSDHGVPLDNIEKRIQIQLLMAARLLFRTLCVSIPELPTKAGRIDIAIQPHNAPVECGVLLELKALRSKASIKDAAQATTADFKKASKYSDRKNEEWVVDGIDQVFRYRIELKAAHAFLCCYDLRLDNGPALVDRCRSLAESRKVELRHYPVFRGAKQWRRSQPGSAYEEWKNEGNASAPEDSESLDGGEPDQ